MYKLVIQGVIALGSSMFAWLTVSEADESLNALARVTRWAVAGLALWLGLVAIRKWG
jgi:hypothetical protein